MFRRRRLILRPTPKIVKLPRIQISLKPFITQILRLNNDRLNFQLFSLLLPREHLVQLPLKSGCFLIGVEEGFAAGDEEDLFGGEFCFRVKSGKLVTRRLISGLTLFTHQTVAHCSLPIFVFYAPVASLPMQPIPLPPHPTLTPITPDRRQ